ncbi:MAG: phosphatase PAP2-related protein [Betaproteobacteria bacterium]
MEFPQWALRGVLIILALIAWFWTQGLIGKRAFPEGRIGDAVLDFTAPLNRYLLDHPVWANRLLIVTSALIDLLGIFLVVLAVFGPSLRPFLGLIILFSLRQLCQGLCSLPPPEGMIWRHPGFPSLLVTYGTASDLFFSGHTAIAVYGCLELAHAGGTMGAIAGGIVAVVEICTVLILRAHYTMDVFTGAVTALWVWCVASYLAPKLDPLLLAWLA